MTARPTEYNHIVFRSKSEAVFARAMDLSGLSWEYEPKQFRNRNGWTPDFEVQGLLVGNALIELKPVIPTDTYLEYLGGCVLPYSARHPCLLICGSVFEDVPLDIRVFVSDLGFISISEDDEWNDQLNRHIQQGREYRFDLSDA